MGLICLTCDRKFFIKTWIGKYMSRAKLNLIDDEKLTRNYNFYEAKRIQNMCKSNSRKWQTCNDIAFMKYKIRLSEESYKAKYLLVLRENLNMRFRLEQEKYHRENLFEQAEEELYNEEQA